MIKKFLIAGLMMTTSSLGYTDANNGDVTYKVTITNITPGQSFTPQLLVTHPRSVRLFKLGAPASTELEILAEGGDTAPLTQSVENTAFDTKTIPGLLEPGKTISATITSSKHGGFLSLAAMMIPTNDNFVAINGIRLPHKGSKTLLAPAYDAGTEFNDQNCVNIPGPICGGEGYSPEPSDHDEGFVHIGNGFHNLGDYDSNGLPLLPPVPYDWRNPVAKITIKRL